MRVCGRHGLCFAQAKWLSSGEVTKLPIMTDNIVQRSSPFSAVRPAACAPAESIRWPAKKNGRRPVAYTYRLQDLLALLQSKMPALGNTLAANHRRVDHGLLSVGLKIHSLNNGRQFDALIEGLGGALKVLEVNYYR